MCVVSMVGDYYGDKWRRDPYIPNPNTGTVYPHYVPITREEFDQLKRDVQEMKELLKRAKAYDEANGEPDCEMDEKVEILKKVAELVGVDLSEIFGDG